MYYSYKVPFAIVIGLILINLFQFGCGEDTAPVAPRVDDLMFKRQLIGEWQVVSVDELILG